MNYLFVLNQLGLLSMVLGALLLGTAAWEELDWWWAGGAGPESVRALLATAALALAGGGGTWFLTRGARDASFGRREALLLVALSWLLGAALAALPFFLWARYSPAAGGDHVFHGYIGAYFEAMSGLTTTGATVLHEIEALPRGLLLWRAMTHWVGGLGIVVLFVAVLPTLGIGARRIFHLEAPGPTASVRPRIRDTARALAVIYLVLSGALLLALLLCGVGLFQAVCHTFSAIATGGLHPRDASVGAYRSTAVNVVTIAFMVLAGVNFGLYYRIARGSYRQVWRDVELRFYLFLLAAASTLVVLALVVAGQPLQLSDGRVVEAGVGAALDHGIFTAVSIQTGTGYVTADFDLWPSAAKAVLVACMFVGGCAGSTTGGLKVLRVWIVLKILLAEIERVFHPNVVRPMRVAGASIDAEMRLSVVVYVLGLLLMCALGSVVVLLLEGHRPEADFATAATASIATLFNVGPGLARVGALEHYGWMGGPTKAVLCVLMVFGRLEVFAILVLFVPRFWRGD